LLKNFACAPQSPAAAKASIKKEDADRSAEPLRHPKTSAEASFSANCKAAEVAQRQLPGAT
jgi:hypothetical protein